MSHIAASHNYRISHNFSNEKKFEVRTLFYAEAFRVIFRSYIMIELCMKLILFCVFNVILMYSTLYFTLTHIFQLLHQLENPYQTIVNSLKTVFSLVFAR